MTECRYECVRLRKVATRSRIRGVEEEMERLEGEMTEKRKDLRREIERENTRKWGELCSELTKGGIENFRFSDEKEQQILKE